MITVWILSVLVPGWFFLAWTGHCAIATEQWLTIVLQYDGTMASASLDFADTTFWKLLIPSSDFTKTRIGFEPPRAVFSWVCLHFNKIIAPVRRLTLYDVNWKMTNCEQKSFEALQDALIVILSWNTMSLGAKPSCSWCRTCARADSAPETNLKEGNQQIARVGVSFDFFYFVCC